MKKIFIPTLLGEDIVIPKDTTHHIVNVFRHNFSEPLTVSDTAGHTAQYVIKEVVDGVARASCVDVEQLHKALQGTPSLMGDVDEIDIVLIQGFLKGDKFEWVLQKSTELNVSAMYAVPMAHCVATYRDKKLGQKYERWQKIVLEASQQCGRQRLPELEVSLSLEQAIIKEQEEGTLVLVAYENEDKTSLREVMEINAKGVKRVAIIIGPEGGISSKEMDLLTSKGVSPVSLGNTILRAETAAIGAIGMLQYALNMR
ncbi:16S rRNA (uracil(1498)-N(3))-methyltransferase [uncultured Veillonella sp.]|uniref:RsmE family RNA methyltransferase n=1 Tax=uncultured Veillonella sp. TaxID=159268 RepID=UPI00263350BE|nr:RsmE family RNA methyltransferase [uncultured Veillonella sp.]